MQHVPLRLRRACLASQSLPPPQRTGSGCGDCPSRRRGGRGGSQSRCRCGTGEPSLGADVAAVGEGTPASAAGLVWRRHACGAQGGAKVAYDSNVYSTACCDKAHRAATQHSGLCVDTARRTVKVADGLACCSKAAELSLAWLGKHRSHLGLVAWPRLVWARALSAMRARVCVGARAE